MEEAQAQAQAQARHVAQLQEQQMAAAMHLLPPANAENNAAGNALLSLLQGAGGAGGSAGAAALLGAAPGGADGGAAGANGADLAGWGRGAGAGRGRGRGVCSAALGTARTAPAPGQDSSSLLQALGSMGIEPSGQVDGLLAQLSQQPGGAASALAAFNAVEGMGAGGVDVSDVDQFGDAGEQRGRRKRNDKKKKGGGDEAEADDLSATSLPPSAQPGPAFAGWGNANTGTLSLAQIQAQEEKERRARDAQAAHEAEMRAAQVASMGGAAASAWGTGNLSKVLTPAEQAPPPMTSFADLIAQQGGPPQSAHPPRAAAPRAAAPPADVDDGLLWDYGAAPAPPPPSRPAAASQPAAKLTPDKTAEKKGKKAPKASPEAGPNAAQGVALGDDTAAFGGGDAAMPPAMMTWCVSQMTALTGNDDTTLADFLFSLQVCHLPRSPLSSLFLFKAVSHLLAPPHTYSHLLSPSHTSSHLLTPPHTSSHLLTPPHTSSHLLTPSRLPPLAAGR